MYWELSKVPSNPIQTIFYSLPKAKGTYAITMESMQSRWHVYMCMFVMLSLSTHHIKVGGIDSFQTWHVDAS